MTAPINDELTFGKHRGKSLRHVAETDPNWIFWASTILAFRNFLAERNLTVEIVAEAPSGTCTATVKHAAPCAPLHPQQWRT